MASILDKWNALQNDPEYYHLSDAERKNAANLWLQQVARKTPEWQDPATRKAIVARVKGGGRQDQYSAFEAAGEGFRHGMDNTITGAAYNRASGQHAAEAPGFLDAMSSLWDGGNSLNPFSEGAGQGYTAAVTSGVPLLADPAGRALDAATAGLAGRGAAAAIEATAPVAPRAAAAIARSAPLVTAAATGGAQGGTFAALDGANTAGIAENAALGAGLGWLMHGRGPKVQERTTATPATEAPAAGPARVEVPEARSTTVNSPGLNLDAPAGPTHVLIDGDRARPVTIVANNGRQLVVDDGVARTTLPADTPHLLPYQSRDGQLGEVAARSVDTTPAHVEAPRSTVPADHLPPDALDPHRTPMDLMEALQSRIEVPAPPGPRPPAATPQRAGVAGLLPERAQSTPAVVHVPPEGFTAEHLGKQAGERPASSPMSTFQVNQQLGAMRTRIDGLDKHLANKKLKPEQRVKVQAMRDDLARQMQDLVAADQAGVGERLRGLADALHASGAEDLQRTRGRLYSGVDPEMLMGHAKQLAGRLIHGAVDAAGWAREMVQAHGEAIAPHLDTIWQQARAVATQMLDFASTRVKRTKDPNNHWFRFFDPQRYGYPGNRVLTPEEFDAEAADVVRQMAAGGFNQGQWSAKAKTAGIAGKKLTRDEVTALLHEASVRNEARKRLEYLEKTAPESISGAANVTPGEPYHGGKPGGPSTHQQAGGSGGLPSTLPQDEGAFKKFLSDESGQAINPITAAADWLGQRVAAAGGLTSGADLAPRVARLQEAIANTASFLATPEGQALDPALATRIATRMQAMRDELASLGGHLEQSTAKAKATAPAVANPAPYDGARKAGNINLERIETTDDIKATYQAVARAYAPEIDAARRGTITTEETQRLADELGLTPQQLLARRKGQAFNAEEALAARHMLASSAEHLQQLAATLRGGQATDEQRLAFRRALELHAQIQAQVSGMTAEAGRALRSFQIQAKGQAAKVRAINEMLEGLGGRDTIDRIAEAMGTLDDPTQLNAFVRSATRPGAADKLAEYYINAILSGPPTQLGNVVGNALVLANRLGETATAAAIGKATGSNGVKVGEVGQQLFGLVQAAREGIELGWQAFRTEEVAGAFTNTTERGQQAIGGAFGRMVRLPSRALSGADVFFKTLVYRSELNALAYRQAAGEGHAGQALGQRVAELLADPPDAIVDAAQDAARYHTFNQKLDRSGAFATLDALGQGLNMAKTNAPALSILVPFVRTPLNIVKYAAERTPIALLSRQVRADIQKAGPERDLALGKIAFGSMLGLLFYAAAKQGLITGGGPSDPNLKKTLADKGWQPYSLKAGDHYLSFTRMGPPGMLAGAAADLAQGDAFLSKHDKLGMAGELLTSAMKNFGDQTFFKGLKDLADALSDPDRFAARYVGGVVGGFAPNLGNKLNQAADPTVRDTAGDSFAGTVGNMVKARIPGLAQTLPQKLDGLGHPVTADAQGGEALLSPFQDRVDKHNPVLDELVRLKVPVSAAGKKVTLAHQDIDLSPDQQRALQQARGQMIEKVLTNLVTSPGYAKLTESQKETAVKRYMERAAHAGQQIFIGQNARDLVTTYREKLAATRAQDKAQTPRPGQ